MLNNGARFMIKWKPMMIMGPICRDKYIRLKHPKTVRLHKGGSIQIPAGAVGYCYSAPGIIQVAFKRDFTPPEKDSMWVHLPYHCGFEPPEMTGLEIEV